MKSLKIRKNRDKFAYGEIDLNNLNQLLKEEVDEDRGMDVDEATELAKESINKEEVEYYIVLYIKNEKVIGYSIKTDNNTNTVGQVPLKQIAKCAILLEADGIINMHNHPANNCSFSYMDFNSLKWSVRIIDEIGVNLVDSIIVTPDGRLLSLNKVGLIEMYRSYFVVYAGNEDIYMNSLAEAFSEKNFLRLKLKVDVINKIIKEHGNPGEFKSAEEAIEYFENWRDKDEERN